MYHFVYKTTNIKNGKYYYGFHSAETLNDYYIGSGAVLKKAIKKYGKESFKREIIELFSSIEEMVEGERRIVNQSVVDDPRCYNIRCGGVGGVSPAPSTRKKLSRAKKGKPHTKTHSRNISIASVKRWAKTEHTIETIQHRSIAAKKGWKKLKKRGYKPYPRSKESNKKHSDYIRSLVVIYSPEGKRKAVKSDELDGFLSMGYLRTKDVPRQFIYAPNGNGRWVLLFKVKEYLEKGFTIPLKSGSRTK